MNKESKYFDIVSRYLDNRLSEEEVRLFENELSTNTELLDEYKAQLEINSYFKNTDALDFYAVMQQVENNYTSPKRKYILLFKIAATILILCTLTFVLFQILDSPANEKIFEEYYSAPCSTNLVRSAYLDNSNFEKGLEAYDKMDFENAVLFFKQIPEKSKNNISAKFYLGISFIELRKYEEAILCFEYLENNSSGIFSDQVIWYLSLCYIVSGKNKKAVPLLNSLIEEGMAYKSGACEILEKINKNY